MITQHEQAQFDNNVNEWTAAGLALAAAERDYAVSYGEAMKVAEGKTDAARQAVASVITAPAVYVRDAARVREQAARYRIAFAIAAIGRREPPI